MIREAKTVGGLNAIAADELTTKIFIKAFNTVVDLYKDLKIIEIKKEIFDGIGHINNGNFTQNVAISSMVKKVEDVFIKSANVSQQSIEYYIDAIHHLIDKCDAIAVNNYNKKNAEEDIKVAKAEEAARNSKPPKDSTYIRQVFVQEPSYKVCPSEVLKSYIEVCRKDNAKFRAFIILNEVLKIDPAKYKFE